MTTCHTGSVGERCSCGTVLIEDALFCHKCGKPTREILAVEVEPAPIVEVAPPPIPVQGPPPIGFHNRLAVRIGLLAGVLSIVVSAITGQVAFALEPLCLIAAGFGAVYIYRRRTGQRLTPLSGAHLGWICGVFGFVIVAVLLTVSVYAMSDSATVETFRDHWKQYGKSDAELNQLIAAFRDPKNILVALPFFFLLFTVLPAFGGAIGAKFLDRD